MVTAPTGAEHAGRWLAPGLGVTVEVPATSANLGPGFDCFGLALDWRERVEVEVIQSGYQLDVSGEGADQVPRDATHLIIRSLLAGLADLGVTAPGLRLTCRNTIPHGRGLGSSSAAIVAGLVAAQALAGQEIDRAWAVEQADAIEGHPDNVAAAVYGGFVLAYHAQLGVRVVQGRLTEGLGAVLFVPITPVATSAARGLLPDRVPHAEAAANAARAALLVHAMAADPGLLWEATRDWLHQDYRRGAMPQSYELLRKLRAEGHPAVISGAGPTVLVLGRAVQLGALRGWRVPGFRTASAAPGGAASVLKGHHAD